MFKIITITFDRNKRGFDEEVLTQIILNKQVTSYHVQFFEDGAEKYKRGLKGVFIPDRFRCNVKNEDPQVVRIEDSCKTVLLRTVRGTR